MYYSSNFNFWLYFPNKILFLDPFSLTLILSPTIYAQRCAVSLLILTILVARFMLNIFILSHMCVCQGTQRAVTQFLHPCRTTRLKITSSNHCCKNTPSVNFKQKCSTGQMFRFGSEEGTVMYNICTCRWKKYETIQTCYNKYQNLA